MRKAAAPPKVRPVLKRALIVPIYDVDLLIVVSNTVDAHVAGAKAYLGGSFSAADFGSASSMYGDDKFASFFLRRKLTPGHIAHELFHNTIRILDYCGVKPETNNHEAFAYLNDYLHRKVYALLRRHNEVIVE